MVEAEVQENGRLPVCASKRILGKKPPPQDGKHRPSRELQLQGQYYEDHNPQDARSNSPQACPECGSSRLYKAGFRYLFDDTPVQRWLCRDCGSRFSEKRPRKKARPLKDFSDWYLKARNNIPSSRQVCVSLARGAKNLDLEHRQEMAQREGTLETADIKIFKFALWLKRNGKAENTIKMRTIMLRKLVQQGACLTDPESVKEAIALRECSNTTKRFMVESYKSFAKYAGIQWEPPKYRGNETIPFIPLEREIDDLIACCSKKTAALLLLLKETGARLGEALEMAWTDLDSEQRVIRIQNPEKGSNPRALRVSDKLLSMLNSLPKESPKIFGGKARAPNYQESFNRFRRVAAFKLQNPRLLQIHFHTLRHWKGTMEYHKTKDPWHVKKVLGHKSLRSTEVYINVEQALFQMESDEFNVKVAEKTDEIKALLEVGFEYVCQKDNLLFFRKRK